MVSMQSARVGQYTVWYENAEEFYELKKEIFTEHRYYVEFEKLNPVIVDLGAHIGMTTLYFKRLYPTARILAYEPVADNFLLLDKNVRENGLETVELVGAAVAPKSGKIGLHVPVAGGWKSGSGIMPHGWRGVQETGEVEVEAQGIREVLQGPIDLVKMDIEGMEYEVIEGADWSNVKNLIVEVHPRKGKRIEEIEKKLRSANFALERRADESRYGDGLVMLYGRKN